MWKIVILYLLEYIETRDNALDKRTGRKVYLII